MSDPKSNAESGPVKSQKVASSPCMADEFGEQAIERNVLIKLLNELVEGERAGAQGLIQMSKDVAGADIKAMLNEVARDEARFCAMLSHHVERFGGTPNRAIGVFAQKLADRKTMVDKLKLLDKGQSVVVQMLHDVLPKLSDPHLIKDLIEMRDVHVVNIERCNKLLENHTN